MISLQSATAKGLSAQDHKYLMHHMNAHIKKKQQQKTAGSVFVTAPSCQKATWHCITQQVVWECVKFMCKYVTKHL